MANLASIDLINRPATQQAIEHYNQLKLNFLNFIKNDEQSNIYKIQNSFERAVQRFLEKWSAAMALDIDPKSKALDLNLSNIVNGKQKDYIIPQQGKSSKMAKDKYFAEQFEKIFSQYLQDILSSSKKFRDNIIAAHTGKIIQEGLTFDGIQNIRSDVGVFNQKSTILNDLITRKLLVEAQYIGEEFTYDTNYTLFSMIDYQHIQKLLNNNFFGFSLKNYDKNIEYTSSVIFQSRITHILQLAMPNVKYPKKNTNGYMTLVFAQQTMLEYLADHIIPILSPTVVALITKNTMIWMNDVVKNSYLYMRMRIVKLSNSVNRSPAKQCYAKFEITSPGIYLATKQNFNIQRLSKTVNEKRSYVYAKMIIK